MTQLGIRYLNGWAMATHPADRLRPEWPPHPDRVFMALAAAHFETGAAPAEARLLARLEERPPVLRVSRHAERDTVTAYVPVNDSASPLKGSGKSLRSLPPLGTLPLGRDRQARQFPVALPEDPVVHLSWPGLDLSTEDRETMAELCAKVTCIGHSASLVQVWVEEESAPANDGRTELVPIGDAEARYRLRVPGPGRLIRLQTDFAAGVRPKAALWCGYEPHATPAPEPEVPATLFDAELLVLRKVEGPALGLESTLQVTRYLRDALLSLCPDPVPEWVSGHRPDGSPSERDHVAFVPLPHVGREHADGHLLGLALAVPQSVAPEERRRVLSRVLFDDRGHVKPLSLRMGRLGLWQLELDDRPYRPVALKSETWTAAPPAEPAARWATVTPIALDRHPKGRDHWQQVTAAIGAGCRRIGLPEPADVVLSPVSLFVGAPHGRTFPALRRGRNGSAVRHTHAVLTFPEPVLGPVMVGAGRYRGYGLCRPLRFEEDVP